MISIGPSSIGWLFYRMAMYRFHGGRIWGSVRIKPPPRQIAMPSAYPSSASHGIAQNLDRPTGITKLTGVFKPDYGPVLCIKCLNPVQDGRNCQVCLPDKIRGNT